MIDLIPCPDVSLMIVAPVTKLCPVKDEVDRGAVSIRYRTEGEALELHSLAAYLAGYADEHLSHEDFTHRVSTDLLADVTSTWTTAGMEVTVEVLRQPVDPSDT